VLLGRNVTAERDIAGAMGDAEFSLAEDPSTS
jgi:hypothetical protein